MNRTKDIIQQLKKLLTADSDLQKRLQQQLCFTMLDNPDPVTNPVRSLEDLYAWLDRFVSVMPWEGIEFRNKEQGTKTVTLKERGLFRRIDQSIGYQYYLFGDLQYEPEIADWLKQYNTAWAEHLNSRESWNNEYFELLKSDPLFELNTGKYESPSNWHCWNDFFTRRLTESFKGETLSKSDDLVSPAEGVISEWMQIDDNHILQVPASIKTATIVDISCLLGSSKYRESFAGGRFCHVTLDMYNYHRFHSPCSGTVVDIQEIDGQLTDGGKIIWDKNQCRYRYEQQDNIGYQMIEKRTVVVIEHAVSKQLIALIPVGVAQVGSIFINKGLCIGSSVMQGEELGHFLCGGSDVIILKSK